MKKKKPTRIPLRTQLRMARHRIRVLEKYGRVFHRQAFNLRKELRFTREARNLLAQAVDPIALVRMHVLSERNLSLENVIVLVRQAIRACPPDTLLTELENDMDRLLGTDGKKIK